MIQSDVPNVAPVARALPVCHVPLDNVIDVHMTRLRKKIDQGFAYPAIHTIRGVGFILREPNR